MNQPVYRSLYEAYPFLADAPEDLRCDFEIMTDRMSSETGLLGVAGFFHRKKGGIFIGTVVGCVCRFIVHFISGITIYKIYEPTELFNSTFTNPYLYSAVYNGSYVFIDMALCLVITALIYKPLKKYINGTDLAK